MFICIKQPGGKDISIFVDDLAGDDNFERQEFTPWDSDRARADRAINRVNDLLGRGNMPAFFSLFNQFRWTGTTGWEYWSGGEKDDLIIKHGLLVAAALGLKLHVHIEMMERMLAAAESVGITFGYDFANPIEQPNRRDTAHLNNELAAQNYCVLTDVVLPADMPAPPDLS